MTISKLFKSVLFSLAIFMAALLVANPVSAASRLYFEPSSVTAVKDQEFDVNLKIDTEGSSVFGTDAALNYPGSDITLVSVNKGDFFSDLTYASSTTGLLEVHAFFSSLFDVKSGSGTVATLKFKALKDSDSGVIDFTCTGSETQIIDSNGSNILSCSSVGSATITYTSSGNGGIDPVIGDPNSCGGTCGSNNNCKEGLYCYSGFCRNPSCSDDTDCNCSTAAATVTPKSTQSPIFITTGSTETGGGDIDDASPTPQIVDLATEEPEDSLIIETDDQTNKPDLIDLIWPYIAIVAGIIFIIVLAKKVFKKKEPPIMMPPTEGQGGTDTQTSAPTVSHGIDAPMSQVEAEDQSQQNISPPPPNPTGIQNPEPAQEPQAPSTPEPPQTDYSA